MDPSFLAFMYFLVHLPIHTYMAGGGDELLLILDFGQHLLCMKKMGEERRYMVNLDPIIREWFPQVRRKKNGKKLAW